MRVSKRYNKHKSFSLRKKSIAANKNKVKKIKIQIRDLIYDATRVTIVNGKGIN
jgi:accessory colonization factor AcfC